MKINIEDLPNILVGEDAERFKEAIENVVPVSKEKLKHINYFVKWVLIL